MNVPKQNPQTELPENNDPNELETTPVQIADNSDVRILGESNILRPDTTPKLRVQS